MARSDMFLKITGKRSGEIKGESDDKVFTNQIDLDGWGWGLSAPTAVGGANMPTGRRLHKQLVVHKRADSSSTALMSVLATNELLKSVELSVRKAGGKDAALVYFKVVLESARIVEYTVDSGLASDGTQALLERISFTFERITIDYTPQQTTGGGGGASTFTDELTSV